MLLLENEAATHEFRGDHLVLLCRNIICSLLMVHAVLAEAIGRKPAIFVGGMLYATGGGIQAGAPLVWSVSQFSIGQRKGYDLVCMHS